MRTMGIIHQDKVCLLCEKLFSPTGANTKRCPPCARSHQLASRKERWHKTYVKKGRNQGGANNNNWKGGVAPSSYQKICFEAHGRSCYLCSKYAVLVHHLDENRANNDKSNLRPMCKRCHQVNHNCAANLPIKVIFKERMCQSCEKLYQPTGPRGSTCNGCIGSSVKV